MERQPHPLLINAQGGGILYRQNVTADDPRAGSRQSRLEHRAMGYLRIVQKPRDPHLACAVATELPDTDAPAAILNKTAAQKGPPFSRRSSPNVPMSISTPNSQVRITQIGSQTRPLTASPTRCVNVVDRFRLRASRFGGQVAVPLPHVASLRGGGKRKSAGKEKEIRAARELCYAFPPGRVAGM